MIRTLRALLDLDALGEAMRRRHSDWLTRALKRGARPPRIPVRKVSDGGWGSLMSTLEGEQWAKEFWEQAFDHPDSG